MASKRTRSKYVSNRERTDQGENLLIDPLDYLIMDKLPAQGTLMGGVVPIGETVRNLVNTAFKDLLSSEEVAGRLNAMQFTGHTVSVRLQGGKRTHGWQITKRGQEDLAAWKAEKGDS